MRKDRDNSNVITPENGVSGRSSRTARKFTSNFGGNPLPQAFSIGLDWLSFMAESSIPPPPENMPVRVFADGVVLEPKKSGTPMFLHGYNIYLDGEAVMALFTHPRNTKIMQPQTAKLEMLNHVLYSSTWLEVLLRCCNALDIQYINGISRLDIAIDGANHIPPFLNNYVRQGRRDFPQLKTLGKWADNQRVRMLGKANLDSKRFNRKTGTYEAFKIGSSRKCITIYNKSREINERSHKEYIRAAWERAGMDLETDNWRVEMRLTSETIKQVGNITISKLADPQYLLEVFNTHAKNFFDFILFENDSNVTRSRRIDLFQFETLRVSLLDKIPRMVVEGAYKAKMAIHEAFKNVMLKRYDCEEAIDNALNHINHTIRLYGLQKFYERKKLDWIEEYKHLERPAGFENYSMN